MIEFGIPAGIFTLDTILKHYVDKNFPMDKKKWILGKRILIHKYYNEGAALNILKDSPKILRGIHGGMLVALAGVYTGLIRQKGNVPLKICLGMILGGGLSNLADRLVKGHVVDYFSFRTPFEKVNKIVFNVSDFFIFFGAGAGCVIGMLAELKGNR